MIRPSVPSAAAVALALLCAAGSAWAQAAGSPRGGGPGAAPSTQRPLAAAVAPRPVPVQPPPIVPSIVGAPSPGVSIVGAPSPGVSIVGAPTGPAVLQPVVPAAVPIMQGPVVVIGPRFMPRAPRPPAVIMPPRQRAFRSPNFTVGG